MKEGKSFGEINSLWQDGLRDFGKRRRQYLLYP
ncbi:MAG: hypothetical protein ACO34E_14760 [Limisphaerales bacterium]